MTSIRAAVCHAFGEPLSIEEVRLAPPSGRSAEVALDATAICHSDITYAEGAWGGDLPAIYGHEAVGRITSVGESIVGHKPGDRVLVTLLRSCGVCPTCSSGHPATCATPLGPDPLTLKNGTVCHQAMGTAAFAERVVVDQSQIVRVPDNIPAEAAALLSCGVITGVGAVVNSARLRPGEDALIIGAGGVGLNTIQGARMAGARRIVAIDILEDKLSDAREFGATDTILATEADPAQTLHNLLGKGVDAVFVTVGAAQIYTTAPEYLAPGGRVVMVGMPATGARSDYEAGDIAAKGQSLIGSKMGDVVLARDIPWLTDLYLQGRLKLDELVSGRWSLDQINEAIADTKSGKARRNVILF